MEKLELIKTLTIEYKNESNNNNLNSFYKNVYENNHCFLPYLFWIELGKWIKGKSKTNNLLDIINIFLHSDNIDEDDLRKMKGMFCVFLKSSSEFDYDRIINISKSINNEMIKNWFDANLNLVKKDASVISIYKEKFLLLQNYFPNFDYYFMTLNQIQTILT